MSKWRRVKSLPRRWQRNHLIAKYGSNCYICNLPIAKMHLITIDHWVPISKNGLDTLDNYRLTHEECNTLKNNMLPEEFREFQLGNLQYTNTEDKV